MHDTNMTNKDEIIGNIRTVANLNTKAKEYWLEKLSGKPEKNCFSYDHVSGIGEARYEQIHFSYPGDGAVYAKLMKLSGASDPRLHMILATVLTLLLYKYTGAGDILLG
ncbi:MAG: hypothetical protein GY757_51225, partial [bacterium]|nr:hypothetical protein [bacterium]